MDIVRVGINGAAGRMGQRLVALGTADAGLTIAAALEHAEHAQLGADAGLLAGIGKLDVPLTADLPADVDSVIDFSVPAAAEAITERCAERGLPLVMATTGLSEPQQQKIRGAAERIAVVWAPNMSLAVNLTMNLAQQAGRALRQLPGGVDVEILERHHRFKHDAPSGTALKFGELIAEVMGQTLRTHGREGLVGERPRNEIAYHAVRTGDNPGEHTIIFGMLGETIELTVRATNRDCYALGALAAARFVVGKPPGLYSMNDVLELS